MKTLFAHMNTFLSLIIVSLSVIGCASVDPALLSADQKAIIVNLAREKVKVENSDIMDADKQFIKDNQPKLSYYILSGTYAQYFISWDVDASHRITVFGQGDIMTLEGATVKKVKQRKNGESGPHGDGGGK